jgi:RNA polymerase sigma-70 factor, ECF subfamily
MSVQARVKELLAADDAPGAATEMIRALGPDVLRYPRSQLGDVDAANEAFSTFAEHAWKGLPAFRQETSLRSWSLRSARKKTAVKMRNEAWHRSPRRSRATHFASSRRDRRGWSFPAGGPGRHACAGKWVP